MTRTVYTERNGALEVPSEGDTYDQRVVEALEILRKIEAFDHQKTALNALRKGDFVSVTNALGEVAETDMQWWVRDVIRILTKETDND
jgi:hypothetical protein